jgi:pyruvate formate lyase activating enzyme
MMKGIIFDIQEFSLNDGPGIRTTVFMKGCPLRCKWCHNPEGLASSPQKIISESECRIVGTTYDALSLAAILKKNADVFNDTGGGITFSGGEPLMQAGFIVEAIRHLDGIHVLLDTSGYADMDSFVQIVSRVNYVYYDLKVMDPKEHAYWTGKDNALILQNLFALDEMKAGYTIRVPLIPAVTDTRENLKQIASLVKKLKHVQELNLLPYNSLAGGKYKSLGMEYPLAGNHSVREQKIPLDVFSVLEIPVLLLNDGTKILSRDEN